MDNIIAEATTQYKARQWHVIDNDAIIISFPPGPAGKRLAQLETLEINRPDLAALVHQAIKAQPGAFSMALKAAAIIQDGLLHSNGACHSQSRPGVFHTIDYDGQPKTYHCTCEAFSYCAIRIDGAGWLCKHCLASHWAYLLGIDLPQQPIPINGEPITMEFNTSDYFNDEI